MWQCWQDVCSVVCVLWISCDFYGFLTQARTFALTPSPSLDLMILKGDVFEADACASWLNWPSVSLLESIALGWLCEFNGPMATLTVSLLLAIFFYIFMYMYKRTLALKRGNWRKTRWRAWK